MFGFQWHLTDRCNLRCRHCYQDFGAPTAELSGEARKQLATRLFTALGDEPAAVDLTGGEPLAMPDFLDLATHVHALPNLAEMGIISNGTLADEALLRRLAALPQLTMLKLSVEGGRSGVHDAIRGPGSFARLKANLPVFLHHLPRRITMMVTLGRGNVAALRETVGFARTAGVAGLMVERFVPLGNGAGMAAEVLSAADWRNVVGTVADLAGLAVDLVGLAAGRAFWLWFDRPAEDALEMALCNLGPDSMALMPDGTVFPCRRLAIPVGNLLNDDFFAIRARLASWDPGVLRPRLRGDLCGACPFPDCPGCRALARALTGDPLADDPQCLLNLLDEDHEPAD